MGATRDSTPSQEGQMALTSLHQPPGPLLASLPQHFRGLSFQGSGRTSQREGGRGLSRCRIHTAASPRPPWVAGLC